MTADLDPRSVLGRVMLILDAFGPEDRAVGLSELARRTGLPKATVHRMCRDLVAARLLASSPAGYGLGRGLFELGLRASVERTLLEVAVPFMQDLYARTRETVHLGVRDGDEVVYVSKIGGHRQVPAPSRVGGRMPLYCTAIGRVLLAHCAPATVERILSGPLPRRTPRTIVAPGLLRAQLDRVLRDGIAFEFEESAAGIACVAAPILGADGLPVAGISVTGPTTRFRPADHHAPVRAAASGVQSILARRTAPTPY
ncbi:IclR family transcriptional regulator [Actinomadura rupiterrae]|uniref:IclR family transcriptional regulator n=1 Tax=Actinomadura rupiterrae TaxID=559627 RepID=UPI0020A576FC|nr:IclR family transcriptional regulator [Actinomadura rupiterrae]MCP2338678.1 DNA-binding IclR family transcriptional regulator [Actinomadura rupiterrae]